MCGGWARGVLGQCRVHEGGGVGGLEGEEFLRGGGDGVRDGGGERGVRYEGDVR